MRETSSILAIDPSRFCICPGTRQVPLGYGRNAHRSCSQATLFTTVPSSTRCTTRMWPIMCVQCCACGNCLHGSFMRATSRASDASVSLHSLMLIWKMQRSGGIRHTRGPCLNREHDHFCWTTQATFATTAEIVGKKGKKCAFKRIYLVLF